MATDFAVSLRRYLTDHMAGLRGCSPNTISSYRDTFKLLICYFRDERSILPERLTLELIDVDTIIAFLTWLRTSRHNSPSTCNQRLAAISSFFSWMQFQDPARMACCQDILQIPSSKHDQPAIAHLTVEQTRLLLALPDRATRQGRRDATLLATLYDTAARVQETADLTVRDLRLKDPAMIALTGKGNKTRHVPIDANTAALLGAYLAERQLDRPGHDDRPVFFNQHHAKLSRGGIAWILLKYQGQTADPTLTNAQLSPHVLRHSRVICPPLYPLRDVRFAA
jgi:site-specific recombinase XerD